MGTQVRLQSICQMVMNEIDKHDPVGKDECRSDELSLKHSNEAFAPVLIVIMHYDDVIRNVIL